MLSLWELRHVGARREATQPSKTADRRWGSLIAITVGLAMVIGSMPAGAVTPAGTAADWEPVQQLDNRELDIDSTVTSRAGTSVVLWSVGGGPNDDLVYTSVRRPGDSAWSERKLLPGGPYTSCSPRGPYAIQDCASLVTAGSDEIVLFTARESEPEAPTHTLTVQRLDDAGWVPLDDIKVPAPIDQVRGSINDEGDYAVLWLDNSTTLGGVSSVQGGPWGDLPRLHLGPGNLAVNHVQVRNDGAIVAVVHALRPAGDRESYKVATLVDGLWTVERLRPHKSRPSSPPALASSPSGALVVGWAEGRTERHKEQLLVRVRAAGATTFGATTRLSTDWPCDIRYTYCATFEVLDSGKVAGLWYVDFLRPVPYGSTYDPASDSWAPRTRLADGNVRAFYDVHPDGTAVMYDDSDVWVCDDVTDCISAGSPDFFAGQRGSVFSQFEAGPDGSAAGFAYLERCPDGSCRYTKLHVSALNFPE